MAKLKIDVMTLHKYYGENEVLKEISINSRQRGRGLYYRTIRFR